MNKICFICEKKVSTLPYFFKDGKKYSNYDVFRFYDEYKVYICHKCYQKYILLEKILKDSITKDVSRIEQDDCYDPRTFEGKLFEGLMLYKPYQKIRKLDTKIEELEKYFS